MYFLPTIWYGILYWILIDKNTTYSNTYKLYFQTAVSFNDKHYLFYYYLFNTIWEFTIFKLIVCCKRDSTYKINQIPNTLKINETIKTQR